MGFMIGALIFIFIMLISLFSNIPMSGTSRYPDGRCYICRRGVASPGETCPKCGEKQPDV